MPKFSINYDKVIFSMLLIRYIDLIYSFEQKKLFYERLFNH